MAANNKIARELLNIISPYNYIHQIALLSRNDIILQSNFHKTKLSNDYCLGTRRCYRYGKRNLDQLFELFSTFNNSDASELREEMCDRVKDEKKLYDSVGHVPVRLKCNNIDTWIKSMCNHEMFADELMLFAMARTFQHHMVVYGKLRCWSTIGTDAPIDGDRLLDISQVHLVYIGENMFAKLRRKVFATTKKRFVSAAPVYDTCTPDETQKTEALNLSQTTTIIINTTNNVVTSVVNQNHDYPAVNVPNSHLDEIPEFPEFSQGGSNSSPPVSPPPPSLLPPPSSPARPAETPSQLESGKSLQAQQCNQPSVPPVVPSEEPLHDVSVDQNVNNKIMTLIAQFSMTRMMLTTQHCLVHRMKQDLLQMVL